MVPVSPPALEGRVRALRGILTALAVVTAGVVMAALVSETALRTLPGFANRGGQDPLPHTPTRYSDGSYRFLETQPDHPTQPIGFDVCVPIPVFVNPAGAAADALPMVRTSIKHVRWATGMNLYYAGPTTATRRHPNSTGITVSWTTEQEDKILHGVDGRGGAVSYSFGSNQRWDITAATVTFNGPAMAELPVWLRQALSDHEFGHAMGLAHVKNPSELMKHTIHVPHYGHGDLTGFAILGSIPCS